MVQVARCQEPVPEDTGEPGWERGVTGGCHLRRLSWRFQCPPLRGVCPLVVVTRATFSAPALSQG